MEDISPFEPTVLGAMRKYWWLVILIVVIITALAIGYASVSPVRYRATANLTVEDPRASSFFDLGGGVSPQRYVADQAAILGSTVVAARAADAEDSLDDAQEVLDGLNLLWTRDSNLIQAVFTSDDPESAVIGANAVASAYSEVRREAISASFSAALVQLDDSIAAVEAQLADLQAQIDLPITRDPSHDSLDSQLSESLARLVTLQADLLNTSGARLDDLRDELDDILRQIETIHSLANLEDLRPQLARDPSRNSLDSQLSESLARLVTLQTELQVALSTASGTRPDDLRDELDNILPQIQILQGLTNLESQRPELAALVEEQRQTVSRKAQLLARKDELSVEARLESTGIVLYSPALFAKEVGSDSIRIGAVGLMLGMLLAAGTAYLLALRKRTFSERGQPELVLGVPLLAEVPNFRAERIGRELPVWTHPLSVSAEAFRFIASAVDVEMEQGLPAEGNGAHLVRCFIVVSPSIDDGKTIVVANTALASVRQGKRVLAIDADFGHQKLSTLLAGEDAPIEGLTDVVERGVPFSDVAYRVPLKEGAILDLVARGTVAVTAPDFFRSSGIGAFFRMVKEEYDLVVIDSPPLLHVAYTSALARYADRALVVVSHNGNVTPVEELADRLAFLETEVMGYVYNKAPLRDDMTRSGGSLQDVLGQAPGLPADR